MYKRTEEGWESEEEEWRGGSVWPGRQETMSDKLRVVNVGGTGKGRHSATSPVSISLVHSSTHLWKF